MALSDDRIQDVQGPFCGDGTCSRSGERLSGEFMSHVQNLGLKPVGGLVELKINSPDVIGVASPLD
jgi:hypothetical protein